MTQIETTFTAFWREVNARLADECERPATAMEAATNPSPFRFLVRGHAAFVTPEEAAASIIRQRVSAARASMKAA